MGLVGMSIGVEAVRGDGAGVRARARARARTGARGWLIRISVRGEAWCLGE